MTRHTRRPARLPQHRTFEYAPGLNLVGTPRLGQTCGGRRTRRRGDARTSTTRRIAWSRGRTRRNSSGNIRTTLTAGVTQARRYVLTNGQLQEQLEQRVDYHYDGNPLDWRIRRTCGRRGAVEFHNEAAGSAERFSYQYSYNQAGRVTNQRMRVTPRANQRGVATPVNLEASYGWDNEGRMTSLTGPSDGPLESYTYDALGGRPPAGRRITTRAELWTFNGVTRWYNSVGQVTPRRRRHDGCGVPVYGGQEQRANRERERLHHRGGCVVSVRLLEPAGSRRDDGRFLGTNYVYDGWGNLTNKTPTKGSPPSLAVNYDAALNMPVGSPLPSVVPQYYYLNFDVEDRPLTGSPTMWTTEAPAESGGRDVRQRGKEGLLERGRELPGIRRSGDRL